MSRFLPSYRRIDWLLKYYFRASPNKKGGEAATIQAFPPCESIHSPSTVIPSAAEGSLLHCRHMHTCALTQTTPWCFLFRLSLAHDLPLCKKDPSTSVGMTGGRRVISHSLSHRLVDPSCAFGAGRLASQEGALMGRLGASLD